MHESSTIQANIQLLTNQPQLRIIYSNKPTHTTHHLHIEANIQLLTNQPQLTIICSNKPTHTQPIIYRFKQIYSCSQTSHI